MRTQTTLLCLAKACRTFAFGLVSVALAIFLKDRGFSLEEIGLLLSATLFEDAVLSTTVSYFANRLGCKRVLMISAILIVICGIVLGLTADKLFISLALILGIVSPGGFEGGPFASIEHSLMANKHAANEHAELTKNFSTYNFAGFAGAALGALLCGTLMTHFTKDVNAAYSAIFFAYAACGAALTFIYYLIEFPRTLSNRSTLASSIKDQESLESPSRSRATRLTRLSKFLPDVPRKKQLWIYAGLQGLDAFGGGLVMQTLLALWFYQRYHATPEFVATTFFWCNVIAGISFVLAPILASRIGLLATMVFTHLPCSLALAALPLCPTAAIAAALLFVRSPFSSIDIPVRQAYTMLIVEEHERVAASATVTAVRATAQAMSPIFAGLFMSNIVLGIPFVLAGLCKSLYDVSLFALFRKTELAVASTDTESAQEDNKQTAAHVKPIRRDNYATSERGEIEHLKERELIGAGKSTK